MTSVTGQVISATLVNRRLRPDLNQGRQRTACSLQHVGRRDPGSAERLLTVGGGGPSHVSFHVGKARASGTGAYVGATRARGQVSGPNGPNFFQLPGILPDVNELLPADISAGKWELHARKDIPVRRDVAGGMTGAAGIAIHHA